MQDKWEEFKKKKLKKYSFALIFSSFGMYILVTILFFTAIISSIIPQSQADQSKNVATVGSGKLCEKVAQDKAIYVKEIDKYPNIQYMSLWILAQVCQESGGQGEDPMQASESKCGKIGCITNKQESIEYGIKLLSDLMRKVTDKKLEGVQTMLQAYNFGEGYLDWLVSKGKKSTTEELAKEYSKEKCGTAGTSESTAVNDDKKACYGDYKYIQHIQKFLESNPNQNLAFAKLYKNHDSVKLNQKMGCATWSGAPYSAGNGCSHFHNGIDLTGGYGAEIYAGVDGTILQIGLVGGWGNSILILANNHAIRYAHFSTLNTSLKKGDTVNTTTLLGNEGSTGFSTGSHLHLSIYKSNTEIYLDVEDPLTYIKDSWTDNTG